MRTSFIALAMALPACGASPVPQAAIPAISEPAPPPADWMPSAEPVTTEPVPIPTTTAAPPIIGGTPEDAVSLWSVETIGATAEGACSTFAPLPTVTCYSVVPGPGDGTHVFALVLQPLGVPFYMLVVPVDGGFTVTESFGEDQGVAVPAWMGAVTFGGPDFVSPYEAVLRTLWSEDRSFQGSCADSGYSDWRVCAEYTIDGSGNVHVALLDEAKQVVEEWTIDFVPERDRYVIVSRSNQPVVTEPAPTAPPTTLAPVLPSVTWDGTYVTEPPFGPLQIGHTGSRVTALQRALGALGLVAEPYDGYFGAATEHAVVVFETVRGMPADGIAGAAVHERLSLPYVDDVAAVPVPATPDAPLGGSGFAEFAFGTAATVVTARLDTAYGSPTVEAFTLTPLAGSANVYSVLLGDGNDLGYGLTFAYPALQIRCHTNGLCIILGGASESQLALRGWSYDNSSAPAASEPLRTPDGVTIGSTTAAFPGLVHYTGAGCFSSEGVADAARTIDVIFDHSWDDLSDPETPAPDQVLTITYMFAGEQYGFLENCF